VGDDNEEYPAAGVDCLRCGLELRELGPAEIWIGGTTGGWKLFFAEWAELGEDVVTLELV